MNLNVEKALDELNRSLGQINRLATLLSNAIQQKADERRRLELDLRTLRRDYEDLEHEVKDLRARLDEERML